LGIPALLAHVDDLSEVVKVAVAWAIKKLLQTTAVE
jgi:hypothetical protein